MEASSPRGSWFFDWKSACSHAIVQQSGIESSPRRELSARELPPTRNHILRALLGIRFGNLCRAKFYQASVASVSSAPTHTRKSRGVAGPRETRSLSDGSDCELLYLSTLGHISRFLKMFSHILKIPKIFEN